LRDAPRGYRWVLVEDRDAYLVDLTSGLIADVVIDLLN
jgi:Ni/Co efflux regulator RcnB